APPPSAISLDFAPGRILSIPFPVNRCLARVAMSFPPFFPPFGLRYGEVSRHIKKERLADFLRISTPRATCCNPGSRVGGPRHAEHAGRVFLGEPQCAPPPAQCGAD